MSAALHAPDRDGDLVAAHVAGDPTAFAELVRRHRPGLRRVATRLVGDPEDAADVVQETFARALRGASRFRGTAPVESWLHRIVTNLSFDLVRNRRARRPEVLTATARGAGSAPDAHAVTELRMVIEHALREVPADHARAVELVMVREFSVPEAALALGLPEGTVKSRCARFRARLHRRLSVPTGTPGDAAERSSARRPAAAHDPAPVPAASAST